MDIYVLYRTTNLENGKRYFGIHKTIELEDGSIPFDGYLGSGTYLRNAVKKYGEDKFIREDLFVFSDKEEAFEFEKEIVNDEIVKDKNTYNLKQGGKGGFNQEEMRNVIYDKYGVENVSQIPEIQEKKKQTCLENWGVEYAIQSEIIKEQIKLTCLEKFGVEFASQSPEIQEKRRQTCLDRYGFDHPNKIPENKERLKQQSISFFEDEANRKMLSDIKYEYWKDPKKREEQSKRFLSENNPMFGKTGEKSPNWGKKHSSEFKQRLSESRKGKPISEETRFKLSESRKGEKNPMFGKSHSEEARQKIRTAQTGTITVFDIQLNKCVKVSKTEYYANRDRFFTTGSQVYKDFKLKEKLWIAWNAEFIETEKV